MQTQNTIEIFPSIQKFFQPLVFGHGWENTEKELYFAFLTCILNFDNHVYKPSSEHTYQG